MREVMRGFRLKVRGMETAAGEQIDKIMSAPTLNSKNLEAMNRAIIQEVMGKTMEALKEGVRFGQYIKHSTPKA